MFQQIAVIVLVISPVLVVLGAAIYLFLVGNKRKNRERNILPFVGVR